MTLQPELSDEEIDQLVVSHNQRIRASVPVDELWDRIRHRLAAPVVELPAARRSHLRRRTMWWLLGAAAALLLVVGSQSLERKAQAQAAETVRAARAAVLATDDRCYRVTWTRLPRVLSRFPRLAGADEARIWTREDRFLIETKADGAPLFWGSDEKQRLWFLVGPGVAIRYERHELSAQRAALAEVLVLRLDTLLDDLLVDFRLEQDSGPGGAPNKRVLIRATRQESRRRHDFDTAELEIDAASNTVERLTLASRDPEAGVGLVTFVREHTDKLDDSAYRVEGHVSAAAQIYESDRPRRRRQLLRSITGWQPANAPEATEAP